jgi:tetratricopeptide (TPR) repeat protein
MLRIAILSSLAVCLISADLAAAQQHGREAHPTQDSSDINLRAQRLYIRGLTAARLENHEEAIRLFEEANRLSSGTAAVMLSLSESYLALGDAESALFFAREAGSLSRDPIILHHLAKLHVHERDFDAAEDVLLELIESEPSNTEALFELARVYLARGDFAAAVATYERLVARVGEDRTIRTQMLQLYQRLGDDDGVERTFRALIQLEPFDTRYPALLARRLADAERLSDAATVLESAVERIPGDVELLFSLIDLKRRLGEDAEAEMLSATLFSVDGLSNEQLTARATGLYMRAADDPTVLDGATILLEAALEDDPDNADLLIMLGDLRYRDGSYSEAGRLLERSLQQNPRQLRVWRQACASYLQADELEDGLRLAEDALILFPGDLPLVRLAANAEMMLYRNAQAIGRFEEGLSILIEDASDEVDLMAEFHGSLGFLYDRTRDFERSDHHYRAAIELDSTFAPVLNNFAFSLAERDTLLSESLQMARRAVQMDSANASYLDTLGWILFKLDNLPEAEEWIRRAVDTGEASATVLEHYGDVLSRLGRNDEALEMWKKATEKSGGSPALEKKIKGDG